MSESNGVAAVPERVLDELAEALIDRLDQLLDRLTDRAVAAPTPGTAVWESEWSDRDTATGRARAIERARVRAELMRRAGAGLGMVGSTPPAVSTRPKTPAARPRKARAGRGRVDDAQLAFESAGLSASYHSSTWSDGGLQSVARSMPDWLYRLASKHSPNGSDD